MARMAGTMVVWVVSLLGLPVSSMAQTAETGSFVLLVGADTVAVEHFTRRADAARSELTGPSIGRILFDIGLSADESVTRLDIQYWMAGMALEGPPGQVATITIEGDTAEVAITSPPEIESQSFETVEGAFLYLNPSFLLVEQMVRHARAIEGDVVSFGVFLAEGSETAEVRVLDPASVSVGIEFGSRIDATVDSEGRLRSATIVDQGLTVLRAEGP